jgi:hypothetical protein
MLLTIEPCPLLSAGVIGSLFIATWRNRFAGRKTTLQPTGDENASGR